MLADLLPPETVDRVPMPDTPPPVHGAQWDEVHGCWERWSEADGRWHVVGTTLDVVRPPAELGDAAEPEFIDLRDPAADPVAVQSVIDLRDASVDPLATYR